MSKILCFSISYYQDQPSGEEGTRSPPATLHRPQNQKWRPGGPKMADGVWKGVYPYIFGRSKQLSQNKFFDPSTPSMRKGDSGEKKRLMRIVATTSLPAVDHPNANYWSATGSCQFHF